VTNGDLIRLAEQEGYELLITIDTNPSLSAEPEKAKPCHPGAQHYQLAQDSSGHRTRPGHDCFDQYRWLRRTAGSLRELHCKIHPQH
jgi:hypothetical protein